MFRSLHQLFSEGNPRVLLFCGLGWVFDLFDIFLFLFVQTAVARDLALADGDLALVHGLTLAASAVGGITFGRRADRLGRRSALSVSIACYAAGAVATAGASGLTSLVAARLLTGFGAGGEWGVGHAVIAEAHPLHLRNRAAALFQALSPVGLLLAAAVGLLLAPLWGWRTCFLLGGLPALLVLFARVALKGLPEDEPEGPGGGATAPPFAALFGARYRRASIVLLVLLSLHMTGFWCVFAWLPRILNREAGITTSLQLFCFFAGMNVVQVVADLMFGPLADRFGLRRVFVVLSLAYGGAQLVAVGFLDAVASHPVAFGLTMAVMGLGAGTWSAFGVLFARHYPAGLRATAASSFYNLSRGLQLPAQLALAAAVPMTGPGIALHVGAVCAGAGALWIYALRAGGGVDGPDGG